MYKEVLEDGRLYQTVVTTGFHNPNASAIGVTRHGNEIHLRVFEGSDTFANLQKDKRFVVHIVPKGKEGLMIRAALTGWGTGKPEFEAGMFDSFHGILYLLELESRFFCRTKEKMLVEVKDDVGTSNALEVVGEVFRDETKDGIEPIAHNESPVVEAAAWATRWKAAEKANQPPLLKETKKWLRKAKKTADKDAIKMVKEFLKK